MITVKIQVEQYVAEYIRGKYFDPEVGAVRFPSKLDIYILVYDLLQKRPVNCPLFKTMKEKHITSYRLEKLGFSRATYYSIQKGNSVSTNTINQLCKLLECNVTDVMEYIEDEEE